MPVLAVIGPGGAGGKGEVPGASGYPRNRVAASAQIVAAAGYGGATRLPVLRSEAPLVLRRTPEAVYLVGGAAGPIGGDVLELRVTVLAGAFLRVRTAAASVALPGTDGLESVLRVSLSVAAGGRLEYLPEPVVVTAGARHATVVSAALEAGASLVVRDELLLGRHGETGGAYRSELRADYAGRPVLRQSLLVDGADAASLGPAVLAGHRAAGSLLVLDPGGHATAAARAAGGATVDAAGGAAVMALAGPGFLVSALADDAVTLRKRLTVG